MAKLIPCDLHVHPDYSIDAKPTIDEYCQRAGQLGIQVLGFSTHYDMNPKRLDIDALAVVDGVRVPMSDSVLTRYREDIETARKKYPGLRILAGVEVDYFKGVEPEAVRIRDKFGFDYFIGSVHTLDDLAISDSKEGQQYFANHSLEQMTDNYFDLLYAVASCGLFEVVGHADYYWRFAVRYFGEEVYQIYRGRLEPIAKAASENGVGFEINTSQIRKGLSYHPRLDFLKELARYGAVVNSLGSDSHLISHLGESINDVAAILETENIPFKPFYETK
jgi:histidinol-phosphatase (PHP family)